MAFRERRLGPPPASCQPGAARAVSDLGAQACCGFLGAVALAEAADDREVLQLPHCTTPHTCNTVSPKRIRNVSQQKEMYPIPLGCILSGRLDPAPLLAWHRTPPPKAVGLGHDSCERGQPATGPRLCSRSMPAKARAPLMRFLLGRWCCYRCTLWLAHLANPQVHGNRLEWPSRQKQRCTGIGMSTPSGRRLPASTACLVWGRYVHGTVLCARRRAQLLSFCAIWPWAHKPCPCKRGCWGLFACKQQPPTVHVPYSPSWGGGGCTGWNFCVTNSVRIFCAQFVQSFLRICTVRC